MSHLFVAAVGAYCANHPNASNCGANNLGADVIAIVILGAIVALALFGFWWRHGNSASNGLMSRLLYAIARRFGPRDRR